MNVPFPQFLMDVGAAMQVPAGPPPNYQAMAANSLGVAPAPAPAPPVRVPEPALPATPAPPTPLAATEGAPQHGPPSPSSAPTEAPAPIMPGYIPFGLHRVSTPGTKGGEVDRRAPTVRALEENAYQQEAQVARDVTQLRGAPYQQEAAAMREQYDRLRAQEDEAQRDAALRKEEVRQKQVEFDRFAADAAKAGKLDPGRLWASRSSGQKAMAMIGLIMGGFASGFRGGPNQALQILDSQIDRDIKAQEFGYYASRDRSAAAQTALGQAIQKFGTMDAAKAGIRAAQLDAMQAKLAEFSALHKDADVQARAAEVGGAIAERRLDAAAKNIAMVAPTAGSTVFVDDAGVQYSNREAQAYQKERLGHNVTIGGKLAETQGQMEIERLRSVGKVAELERKVEKQTAAETRAISAQLQQAGVPQARHSIESAMKLLNESEGGIGEAAVRGALGSAISEKVLSEKANAREQAFKVARADMIHALTGAGMSDTERASYYEMFGAATTPEARRRTLAAALTRLNDIEKNAMAGASPDAQEAFIAQRKGAAAGEPVAPKGASPGWGPK